MFAKKQYVTLFFMAITTIVSAQNSINNTHLKNDFGIFINVPNGMPSLEYRRVLNDKYKLRIGLDHVVENTNYGFFGGGPVVYGSDSLVVQEYQVNNYLKPALRIGFDRQLPYKYLSIGADLQVQYIQEEIRINSHKSIFSAEGEWEGSAYQLGAKEKSVRNHYIRTALRGNVSAQFPLGENYLLTLYYAASVGPQFFLKESNRNDPAGDFPQLSGFSIEVDSSIGLGIRYLLNRND